jgi:hypothetical protein
MKTYGGEKLYLHFSSTSSLHGGEWSAQLHAPAALPPPPGEDPWFPLDRRLGEDIHLLALPGIEPRPPIPSPVAILTELSRLHY